MAKVKVCTLCKQEFKGSSCPKCAETGVDVAKVLESEKEPMEKTETPTVPTAFLVDLVSNRKIPITTPRCRVGRDDLNDIVISGDQSISRFHFIITYENGQYQVQDAKSRHGTFLNGNQISGPEPINDGDVLKIGVSLFWFVIESQTGGSLEEALPPVDVEKINSEELTLKVGGEQYANASKDLSATQEMNMLSEEDIARIGEELAAKADEGGKDKGKEPAGEDSLSEKTDKTEPESKKAEPSSSDDKKVAAEEHDEKPEAEKKAEKADVDSKPEEQKDDKADVAEEPQAEKKESKEEEPEKSDSDSKDEPESKKDEPEPKKDDDGFKDGGILKEEDIASTVKELLEPLHSEIEASREMIRDALKKGELKSESEKDEAEAKEEPEQKSVKQDEPEPAAESHDESRANEAETKHEEPSHVHEDSKNDLKDDDKEEPSAKKDKATHEKSAEVETLEKIAEIIDDSSGKTEPAEKSVETVKVSNANLEAALASEKATNGLDEDITAVVSQMGPSTVPDWCKRYFSDELKHLNKELDALNEEIRHTQEKIRKIETQAALTKGLRNTLLAADGDDLLDACKRILGLTGWKVTQSEDDKHELLLEHDDEKVAIARIISTKGSAERSHLGELSISQTRYWCEKGVEPKGLLIIGKVSDKAPHERGDDADPEVVNYASHKNVCIMSTLQLLALYRDIALKDGKTGELRESIYDSKGWLKGFHLEPGDEFEEEEKESSKGKSLSSLLSA